jgi:hypothetical protein
MKTVRYAFISELVLYESKMCSLKSKEEHRLTVGLFKDKVLRKLFGPNGDEVTGCWRKFRNEELHNLYC